MPARPLSDAQWGEVSRTVIALSARSGLEGWRIADVVAKTGVSSRTLYKYFPSKACLLLYSLLAPYGPEFAELFEVEPPGPGASAELSGSSPLTRVRGVLAPLTEGMVGAPVLTKAVRALTSAKPGVAEVLLNFSSAMRRAIARAVADGEPGPEEEAVAEVIQQVWFAAVVAWASDLRGPSHIDEAVVPALRLVHTSGGRPPDHAGSSRAARPGGS